MSQFDKLDKIMRERLKKNLDTSIHWVLLRQQKKLAKIHGVDENSAALAALLHDYGKHLKKMMNF